MKCIGGTLLAAAMLGCAPVAAGHAIKVLSVEPAPPRSIVAESDAVYWIADRTPPDSLLVRRLSKSDKIARTLWEEPGPIWPIVMAGHLAYWVVWSSGTLSTRGTEGDAETVIATGLGSTPAFVTADTDYIYWSSFDKSGEGYGDIWRVAAQGGQEENLTSGDYEPSYLTLNREHLYWTSRGDLRELPKTGGTPRTVATLQPFSTGLIVDDHFAFFTCIDNRGSVRKVSLSDGKLEILTQDLNHPRELVLDGSNIYFTNEGEGTVLRVSKSGGSRTTLASGLESPFAIAMDVSSVYVGTGTHAGYSETGKDAGKLLEIAK